METGEGSMSRGGGSRAPSPPTVQVGIVKVTVNHRAVCWDSAPAGSPTGHDGATVMLFPATGAARRAVTDAHGLAQFDDVPVGTGRVEANATGYVRSSAAPSVTAGATTQVTLELTTAPGGFVTCNRRHTPRPTNPPTVTSLPGIFWHDHVMIWIREFAWLLFLALMVGFLVVAIVNAALAMHWHPGYAGFALPVACFAVVGFLVAILFGEIAGIIMIVLAGIAWLALVGITIAVALGVPGLLPLDYVWFPVLCGMWTSFFVFLPIRMSFRLQDDWPFLFLFPLPAIVVGVVLYLVMVYVPEPNLVLGTVAEVLYPILCVVLCFIFGLLAGLSGHVFANDGKVEPYTAHTAKMSLPFAGERYCVQGNRGWFSHYASNGQERCYDFAVDAGSHVLAIEEGHVIEFRQDMEKSYYDGGSDQANYIYVQHRDGTIARYLHLQKHGISAINPVLVRESTASGAIYTSNVHVHAGQILALAGSTGISRFPHIHLGLFDAGTNVGLEFKDADVQRHAGRCFTFRKYLSGNPDNGAIGV